MKTDLPLKPSANLVVQIKAEGVVWVKPNTAPPRELQYHELLALSELDRSDWYSIEELAKEVAVTAQVKPGAVLQFLRIALRTERLKESAIRSPERRFVKTTPLPAQSLPDPNTTLVLAQPIPILLDLGHFVVLTHAGQEVARLQPGELWLLSKFVRPTTLVAFINDNALTGLGKSSANLALPNGDSVAAQRIQEVLGALEQSGMLTTLKGADIIAHETNRLSSREKVSKEIFAREAALQSKRERHREIDTGLTRTKVIPVYNAEGIPTALGMIFAYAKAFNGGALEATYNFCLDWVWDSERLPSYTSAPAIYLFSNYLWSHENNLEISRQIKTLSPQSITIHGGPDTPKYEQDAQRYFDNYPHVDIIVRGEGEASAAETLEQLQLYFGAGATDFSMLHAVEGISYRHDGKIQRNPDRPRLKNLDSIPSPFLTGLFDNYRGVPRLHATLETNRGCPYGCTFCDWGSATSSKIRKFDLDRVLKELQWCSDTKVQSVALGDANFGVFERDITVAEKVASLKTSNGYPETFNTSYAKNSTKYLQTIVRVMAEAGILAQGVLSLQTMDTNTLDVIKRSNIKTEQYNALANEMRRSNLQLTVELMMGLPGSTLESLVEDLQQCIDRDIPARVNSTALLINSPMNSPEYRKEHALETNIEVDPGQVAILISSRSFTQEEYLVMLSLRRLYIFFDNFGVLRLTSRFVRQRTGIPEMSFYQRLLSLSGGPLGGRWPTLETLVHAGPDLMAAPFSWALMLDELKDFLVTDRGLADDSALQAILRAQHALLPSHGRRFPDTLSLEHDVVAWHQQMLAAKESGHLSDWTEVVPDLALFSAGDLEIDDPDGSVTKMLGCDIEMNTYGVNWDFESGVGRARVAQDFTPAWEEEAVQVI